MTRAEIITELAPALAGRVYKIEPSTMSLSLLDWHELERQLRPYMGEGLLLRDGIRYPDGILSVKVTDKIAFTWTELQIDFS